MVHTCKGRHLSERLAFLDMSATGKFHTSSLFKIICSYIVTLSLPESVMETFKVVLTFESVDEILWCDPSNENSLAVLSVLHMVFILKYLTIRNLGFVLKSHLVGTLGVKGIRDSLLTTESLPMDSYQWHFVQCSMLFGSISPY